MLVEISVVQASGVGAGVVMGLLLWACQRACEPTQGAAAQARAERVLPFASLHDERSPSRATATDGIEMVDDPLRSQQNLRNA